MNNQKSDTHAHAHKIFKQPPVHLRSLMTSLNDNYDFEYHPISHLTPKRLISEPTLMKQYLHSFYLHLLETYATRHIFEMYTQHSACEWPAQLHLCMFIIALQLMTVET